ncbi:MAG: hypothetical protein BZY88_10860 [SAR202 cluster bacterium Io17-Chloro-G9]|nr:MAG: hypothetical protein BZY88_10860 [SAR202 cluster bacterium Io17-Chloro-G9]
MKTQMSEVPAELQAAFYGVAIASGFGLLALSFTVCDKLHREVHQNERNLREQHSRQQRIAGWDLWASIEQKALLDDRIRNVDRLDLLIRVIGGFSIVSGVAGFIVLGFQESYGFNVTSGTLASILLELLPFLSLAAVLATLSVTYRAIYLSRWFAKAAEVALPTEERDSQAPPGS